MKGWTSASLTTSSNGLLCRKDSDGSRSSTHWHEGTGRKVRTSTIDGMAISMQRGNRVVAEYFVDQLDAVLQATRTLIGARPYDHDPRHLGLLSRQRRRARRRRRDRRRRAGRAIHAQEARSRFPRTPSSTACSEAGMRRVTSTTSCSTRSRSASSSACSRRISRLRRAGFRASAWRSRCGSRRSSHLPSVIRQGLGGGVEGADRLHRPSREPRRQRVLSQPVRRGGDPDARRRRRMDHDDAGRRPRQSDRADASRFSFRIRSACCTRRSPTTAASR